MSAEGRTDRSVEMISVLNSRMPLQDELRARVKDGTVTLNGVAIAAHYLRTSLTPALSATSHGVSPPTPSKQPRPMQR
jgi:hypothetical protein